MKARCLDTKKMGENIKRLIKESEYRTQENFASACIDEYLVNTVELGRRYKKQGNKKEA
ncbi:MAG: hypothetical protein IKB27_02600 [Clostridia bacterium]|nr:hypothetical protein [Clostridia bacterium]